VQLTIPVAIDRLSATTTLELHPVGNAAFRGLIYRESLAGLKLQAIPANASRALDIAIEQRTTELARAIPNNGLENAIYAFSKQAVADLSRIVSEYALLSREDGSADSVDYGAINDRIQRLSFELIQGVVEKQVIDQLEVVAESYRLREQRPEDIVQIRLIVSEDGMEWDTVENSDGSVTRKLIPE